jgi:nitrate reductase NapAB chaperone NapD
MIASVVATLEQDVALRLLLQAELAARPELEAGEWSLANNRLPITIEVQSRHQMEDSTTWLRNQPGVQMVDVVFVHFEDET